MSATIIPHPVRQPFGSVSQSRLHHLANTKNTQNAISAAQVSSKKPDFSSFAGCDSENVDPSLLVSPSKARAFDFTTCKGSSKPQFTLKTTQTLTSGPPLTNPSRKRKADDGSSLNEKLQSSKRRAGPLSAPVIPIGRSPTRKHAGIRSRHRANAPVTRIDPPGGSSTVPFSLGAALAGTVPLKPKKKSHKKAWDFEIYEDTPTDEMSNLMEHSTGILDISDDEGRSSPKGDRDNKENIPPSANIEASASFRHQDSMSEEVRTPLGDLDAKSFYAEGCDETTVLIVPAEVENEPKQNLSAPSIDEALHTSNKSEVPLPTTSRAEWEALLAEPSAKKQEASHAKNADVLARDPSDGADIQIWESESAKAENEGKGSGTVDSQC